MANTLHITNDRERPFVVRIIRNGDRYGLHWQLTYGEEEYDRSEGPCVEFYDATYRDDPQNAREGALGQFVSRYYATSLLVDDITGKPTPRYQGLCLDGGNADVWSIDGVTMKHVRDWIAAHTS